MIDGPLGGAAFNNEFGRPNLGGYFRVFEQTRRRRAARLSQADHDRRRPRHDRRGADEEDRVSRRARCSSSSAARACASAWAAARPARWPPAPTPPNSTSIRCSAATRRSSGARRKSSTAAWRSASAIRSWRSTTSAPAACPTRSRSWSTAPGAAPCSTCAHSGRGERPRAEGDLVQREPGALRAGHRRRRAGAFGAICARERCPFAVVGTATDGERARASAPLDSSTVADTGQRRFTDPPIDMPMDVLLGKPPKMHRDVTRRALSPRRSISPASRCRRPRSTCCAIRRSRASGS